MLCNNLEGQDGVYGGKEVQEGMFVYLQLIHVVCPKPAQHCKAVTTQLKILLKYFKNVEKKIISLAECS